jgi:YD repeat-containing protein
VSATEVIDQIRRLSPSEQKLVAEFVHSLEYDSWDREIAAHDAAGKLDFLKEEARAAKRQGLLKPIP